MEAVPDRSKHAFGPRNRLDEAPIDPIAIRAQDRIEILQPDQALEAMLVDVRAELNNLIFRAQRQGARQARDGHCTAPACNLARRP